MSAMESGTEMSPCPRGYRSPARDALHGVMMLSSRQGIEVRGSGRFGSSAARRMPPRALAMVGARRGLGWGRNNRTAARHRALFPNNPLRPSLLPPIDPVAVSPGIEKAQGSGSAPHHAPPSSFRTSNFSPFIVGFTARLISSHPNYLTPSP
jgi:hypothetical protein